MIQNDQISLFRKILNHAQEHSEIFILPLFVVLGKITRLNKTTFRVKIIPILIKDKKLVEHSK